MNRVAGVLGMVVLTALVSMCAIGVAQAPRSAVLADSSAVIVLVDNDTSVPVATSFGALPDTAHVALGWCPPITHCLYVIPSDRLGSLATFVVGGLAYGETKWYDSKPQVRVPGAVNVVKYRAAAPEVPPGLLRRPISAQRCCGRC